MGRFRYGLGLVFGIFALSLIVSGTAKCESDQLVSIQGSSAYSKVAKAVKKGIKNLPSSSSITQSSSSSRLALYDYQYGIAAVSGTAPTLPEIAAMSTIKDLFWLPGVVDSIAGNTASPNECSQFFSSNVDGLSGGFGACNLAEGVGHSFETILHAETSLCYMKNMPTKSNLNAGGITVVSGNVTSDNIKELFRPKSKPKLIKVNTPEIQGKGQAEAIFINLPSRKENKEENFLYQAEIYFCAEGQSSARGYNLVQVYNEGNKAILRVSIGNASDPFGGGSHSVTVQGAIKKEDGELVWNRTQDRQVTVEAAMNSNAFKNEFTISSGDRIELKRRADFLDLMNNPITDKGYDISNFSATDVFDVRFLQGAFKGEKSFGMQDKTFSGATEFRSTYYAAAPDNALLTEVDAYDIDSDPFYDSAANVVIDTSAYSCAALPDIELTMNAGNETLEASLEPCFNNSYQNMQFCNRDTTVNQALQEFHDSCPIGGGGGGPGGG